MNKKITAAKMKDLIVAALKDHKAMDIVALNIKTITDIADYMVVCTANSTIHVKTLIEKTREKLAAVKIKSIGVEGEEIREWMLIDFGDVIVHVMLEPVRKFYALEKLWDIKPQKPRVASKKKGVKN